MIFISITTKSTKSINEVSFSEQDELNGSLHLNLVYFQP